eukprot:c8647_g1_i1.p1 GENE.c8647_g1_i1~~c8647_g1_i1.p1  ORF type:complete len:186 (+),score=62.61 c8647_g1_i1:157-714(+)
MWASRFVQPASMLLKRIPATRNNAVRFGVVSLASSAAMVGLSFCDQEQKKRVEKVEPTEQATSSSLFSTDDLAGKLLHGGGTLTFGGIMGFCSGVALKKVGKVMIVLAGGVFAMFQLAANAGYVDIHWEKVQADFKKTMDLNGDGKLDQKDLQIALTKTTAILTNNMATTAAGFTGGFLIGLKKG